MSAIFCDLDMRRKTLRNEAIRDLQDTIRNAKRVLHALERGEAPLSCQDVVASAMDAHGVVKELVLARVLFDLLEDATP